MIISLNCVKRIEMISGEIVTEEELAANDEATDPTDATDATDANDETTDANE